MNDDDKSFFSLIKNSPQSHNSDVFITVSSHSALELLPSNGLMVKQLKSITPPSTKLRTIAIIKCPSIRCDIIYGTSRRMPIETLGNGMKYEQQKKCWDGWLINGLENTIRGYIEAINKCASNTKVSNEQYTKNWGNLYSKYKITESLSYIIKHHFPKPKNSGSSESSNNNTMDSLHLLLKAHKKVGPYCIGPYDDKYPRPDDWDSIREVNKQL